MKTLTTITLLFLSFGFINLNAQELKEFETKEYSIKYPKNWTFDTSGQMNTSFLIFSELEKDDAFRENINLMIQDLTGMNLDLKGYTELSVSQIKATKDSEIFESKDIKRGDETYHEIVWKGFVAGKKLKFKQLYFIKNNKAFLLTLTCAEKDFDNYVKTGTAILNGFILK